MRLRSRLLSAHQGAIAATHQRRRLTGAALLFGLVIAMSTTLALNPFNSRAQVVNAAVSRSRVETLSSDFTSAMIDSAFCVGHFANSALVLNLSATSS